MGMETNADPNTLRAELESLRIERGGAPPPARRARRRIIALVVLGLIGVAGVLLVRRVGGRATPVTVAPATLVDAASDLVTPVLSGSGYVVTGERYVSLGVRVPGRIERYFVEEGQAVRRGDPLVQLDDRDYRASVARGEAALELARANLTLAEADLLRGQRLRQDGVVSEQEIDVLQNKAAVARAAVAQTEAELAQGRVNLEYTLLRAPTNGIVLAKLKEVGEIAVPGGFEGSGDLIRLANLSDLRAEVDVNESDLNRVRLGQRAEVTPDAYPDAHYRAEVVKMYPQVDRQKGTLKIEVRVPEADGRLLPDMSVRVTFLEALQAPDGAALVRVPAAALRRAAAVGPFVWVVSDGRVRRVAVALANEIGDPVHVTRGLAGGESVVVSDDRQLRDGTKVTVAP
jgi:RND family efflux transporter MFP subunit